MHTALCSEQLCSGSVCFDGQRDVCPVPSITCSALLSRHSTWLLSPASFTGYKQGSGGDRVKGSSQDWGWYLLRLLKVVSNVRGWYISAALKFLKRTLFVPI